MQQYIDLLVHRLDEHAQEAEDVDIMHLYNYTTFDIISDLTFGEPLFCLRDSKYHLWVQLVFAAVKALGLLSTLTKYLIFDYYEKIRNFMEDKATIQAARAQFFRLVTEKVDGRLEQGVDRPDFFGTVMKNQPSEEKRMTRAEMISNAILFLGAGSETTATTLSGTTYLLLKNPDKYDKLVREIRTIFSSIEEITIEKVNNLEYMIACLQEGLRHYPPVPTGFPRVVPAGGDTISGHFVPEGTAVYICQYAANHSPRNFKNPEAYVPERWLGDVEYTHDNRKAFNPFSFGPRNCIGRK